MRNLKAQWCTEMIVIVTMLHSKLVQLKSAELSLHWPLHQFQLSGDIWIFVAAAVMVLCKASVPSKKGV